MPWKMQKEESVGNSTNGRGLKGRRNRTQYNTQILTMNSIILQTGSFRLGEGTNIDFLSIASTDNNVTLPKVHCFHIE